MDEIERIKALWAKVPESAAKLKAAKPESIEQRRADDEYHSACHAFSIAAREAWPSFLARIEAGERLAEEMERITNPPPAAEFSWTRNLARAALAAFAKAKEGA